MSSEPVNTAGDGGPSAIGSDRLIGIQEVKAITGLADRAASELMSETGSAFRAHGRKYVLESDLLEYLKSLRQRGV